MEYMGRARVTFQNTPRVEPESGSEDCWHMHSPHLHDVGMIGRIIEHVT